MIGIVFMPIKIRIRLATFHCDADQDPDTDATFYFDADQDPDTDATFYFDAGYGYDFLF